MSLRAGNIRQAVRDVVEGATGPYASRLAGLFEYNARDGVFEPTATQALGERHVYDVQLGELAPSDASPVGAMGSFRLVNLPITVHVITKIPPRLLESNPPQVDHALRDATAQTTVDRLDMVAQSLATPGALTTTAAGEATGIVSGLLRSPEGEGFPDVSDGAWDWVARRVTHEIRARAIVRIDRP